MSDHAAGSYPVKQFVMDGKVVVGVGNIYANEALFMAGITLRAASRVALKRYESLAETIKTVLRDAIEQGGTTLQILWVVMGRRDICAATSGIGRQGQPCRACKSVLKKSGKAVVARFFVRAASADPSGRSTPQSQPDTTPPH